VKQIVTSKQLPHLSILF